MMSLGCNLPGTSTMNDHWDNYGPYQISNNKVYVKNVYHGYDLNIDAQKMELLNRVDMEIKRLNYEISKWYQLKDKVYG